MIGNPDEKALREAARLTTQDFANLTSFFEKEQVIIDDRMRSCQDVHQTLRLQGRSQGMKDLLDLIRNAPEKIGT